MSPVTEPISPELVLVDSELAERARQELPLPQSPARAQSPAHTHAASVDDGSLPRTGFESRPAPAPATPAVARPSRPPAPRPMRPAVWQPEAAPEAPARRRRVRRLFLVLAGVSLLWGGFAVARHVAGHRSSRIAPISVEAGSEAGSVAALPSQPSTGVTAPPRTGNAGRRRTFVWVPVREARFYEMRIFRRDVEIFGARTATPRLVLPRAWRYKNRLHRLVPGRYRWLVLPGFGPRSHPRYGAPIVSAELSISR